jgi:membrane dipeptidase
MSARPATRNPRRPGAERPGAAWSGWRTSADRCIVRGPPPALAAGGETFVSPDSRSQSISRRDFGRVAAGAMLAPHVALRTATSAPAAVHPDAASIGARWPRYAGAMVIDFLASPGPFNTPVQVDALTPEMVRNAASSGITAVNLTIGGGDVEDVFRDIARWERDLRAHPDVLMPVRTVADLRTAKESRRLGLIYGFQDTAMMDTDLSRVALFQSFGVRIMQLTYNGRNAAGDGCLEPANGGLSRFGRSLVAELNAQRVIVDLGHCGQKTTADGIEESKLPVAISHSGCKAIADRPRSKRDEEIKRMADKGGVLGIYLMPFLTARGQPMADDVIRHIEHAIDVGGEDHVGIGSDLSITPHVVTEEYKRVHRTFVEERMRRGIAAPGEDPEVYMFVPDLNTPRRMELIADKLLARGHGEARVEKIIGGNFVRLMKDVWGG